MNNSGDNDYVSWDTSDEVSYFIKLAGLEQEK
jgi:hypothetical protein